MNKEDIKELISVMKAENMKVISIETKDLELYLEAYEGGTNPSQSSFSSDSSSAKSTAKSEADNASKPSSELIDVRVDQVGTFYTQPEEDSDETFVKVGDRVAAGDQVGLIETMKLFNDFRVDQAGIIEEILVENGEAVEYDQVVMRLRSEEA